MFWNTFGGIFWSHARANRVELQLESGGGRLTWSTRDDGQGADWFNLAKLNQSARNFTYSLFNWATRKGCAESDH